MDAIQPSNQGSSLNASNGPHIPETDSHNQPSMHAFTLGQRLLRPKNLVINYRKRQFYCLISLMCLGMERNESCICLKI